MALRETAKQFSQLCAEDAWSKLRMSPRIALHCVYGLPHLQQLALVQRAQALAESLRDEEMHLEIAHCAEHGRCRQLRRGAVTRAQRRVNPGLADGGDRHAWTCDDHHPELLTAMTLALYCAAARGRAAAWQLEGCPALMRLARSKEVRVLLAVVLNEDPVAASSAAKALGLLGSHPRARDVAVPALVHALLAGADHELPHGARALQARRSAGCGPRAWAVAIPPNPPPTCPPPAPRCAAPPPARAAHTLPSHPSPTTRRRRWRAGMRRRSAPCLQPAPSLRWCPSSAERAIGASATPPPRSSRSPSATRVRRAPWWPVAACPRSWRSCRRARARCGCGAPLCSARSCGTCRRRDAQLT